ncbi:hypothetical protein BU16DRAFT_529681 [Lophium mytilinum]|uniref:Uncharacterized protein n=1 Tax=Lophium mytilinum TaxID=390894 RepID=A0A6A6QJC0_9PEZI|nr:hypothetical protein BU16DRAFT_529681 [Lophium mytilinum]
MPKRAVSRCTHPTLTFDSSNHAAEVGFRGPTPRQLAAVHTSIEEENTKSSGKRKRDLDTPALGGKLFPAPLILPEDDLALDPTHPPQSFSEWKRMRQDERNRVTNKRKTIYVIGPPAITDDVDFVQTWNQVRSRGAKKEDHIPPPDIQDVVDYLSAYYHGMTVEVLPPSTATFIAWEAKRPRAAKALAKSSKTPLIGLQTSKEIIGIRTRPSLDKAYKAQLNLDDLLDAAIAMLPADAFALLFLVQQDLYQSPEDEFVCGLAYGGSRVSVVSMARYHPGLDSKQEIEREHAWPASHCATYVASCCDEATNDGNKAAKRSKNGATRKESQQASDAIKVEQHADTPLRAAITAHAALPSLSSSPDPDTLTRLWLGRVCRTASHEVAHCFGIGHCVYYGCNMQGSASIREDARQAPYLCPVDWAKLQKATGVDASERSKTLIKYCNDKREIHLFAALGAWLENTE